MSRPTQPLDGEPGETARPARREVLDRAAAALSYARPRLQVLLARGTPRARIAGRAALRYAKQHEDDLKQAAAALARARLRGPARLAIDAIINTRQAGSKDESAATGGRLCSGCGTLNPSSAKFCSECGRAVASKD